MTHLSSGAIGCRSIRILIYMHPISKECAWKRREEYVMGPSAKMRAKRPGARVNTMLSWSNGNIFRFTGLFVGNPPVTGGFPS